MNNLRNPEIEMYLVATALGAPQRWHEINHVHDEDFTDDTASKTWAAIRKFILAGRQPNAHSIAAEIYTSSDDQKSFVSTLIEWQNSLLTTSNGPEYARCIKDLSDRRKIIGSINQTLALAQNTTCGMNAAEITSRAINNLMIGQLDCPDFIPAHQVGETVIANLDKNVPVFKTGFPRLDTSLGGGFYQGRYYGLGARMKSGKSLLMGTLAYNMTTKNAARVLYLCLEMGAEETYQRILSMHMNTNSLDFSKPEKRNQVWFRTRVREANEAMKKAKLYFRSQPRMTIDDLKAAIARAGMSGKYDGIIVDYLQLVEGKQHGQSSAEHYDNVAQTLAEAVKRHPIWILSAAQLNKDGNIRGSEGLLNACDLAFSINKLEGALVSTPTGERKNPDRAWLGTMVSRYTPYMDIGSEHSPSYEIDTERGPSFVELPAPPMGSH